MSALTHYAHIIMVFRSKQNVLELQMTYNSVIVSDNVSKRVKELIKHQREELQENWEFVAVSHVVSLLDQPPTDITFTATYVNIKEPNKVETKRNRIIGSNAQYRMKKAIELYSQKHAREFKLVSVSHLLPSHQLMLTHVP